MAFTITDKVPIAGAADVAKDAIIAFSLALSGGSVIDDVSIYVRNSLVYSGASGEFSRWWRMSAIVDASPDYNFVLAPDRQEYYREAEVVPVKVVVGGGDEQWSFTAAQRSFRQKTYRMMLRALCKLDEDG